MDELTIATYNKMAREYEAETSIFWDLFPSKIIDKFVELLVAGGQVLNIGCGPGRDGLLLKDRGLDVVGIDASEEMIRISSEKGLKSVVGNFMELPYEDGVFDGVWSYTSFLHIKKKDINIALNEAKRVLKKGGIFALGLIEGEGERYSESSGVTMPRWFSYYTKEEIEKLLEDVGFELVYFEGFKPRSRTYLNFVCKKR